MVADSRLGATRAHSACRAGCPRHLSGTAGRQHAPLVPWCSERPCCHFSQPTTGGCRPHAGKEGSPPRGRRDRALCPTPRCFRLTARAPSGARESERERDSALRVRAVSHQAAQPRETPRISTRKRRVRKGNTQRSGSRSTSPSTRQEPLRPIISRSSRSPQLFLEAVAGSYRSPGESPNAPGRPSPSAKFGELMLPEQETAFRETPGFPRGVAARARVRVSWDSTHARLRR